MMRTHAICGALIVSAAASSTACILDQDPTTGSTEREATPLQGLHHRASHNTYKSANTPAPPVSPILRQIKWHFRQQTDEMPPNPTATMHIEIDLVDYALFASPTSFGHTWWVAHDHDVGAITPHCGGSGTFNDCLNSCRARM
jgi:hypothetical protein